MSTNGNNQDDLEDAYREVDEALTEFEEASDGAQAEVEALREHIENMRDEAEDGLQTYRNELTGRLRQFAEIARTGTADYRQLEREVESIADDMPYEVENLNMDINIDQSRRSLFSFNERDDSTYEISRRDFSLTTAAIVGGGLTFFGGLTYSMLEGEDSEDSASDPGDGTGSEPTPDPDTIEAQEWYSWDEIEGCFDSEHEGVFRSNLVDNGEYDSLGEIEYMLGSDSSEVDVYFRDGETGEELSSKYNDANINCEID